MRRRSSLVRQQRSDDKIVKVDIHVPTRGQVAISAISAIAGGHVLALVCRDLVDLSGRRPHEPFRSCCRRQS